ncbi:MAG: LAGLIDADG family homing endonuclease [Candidatus Lokiarchaeota archaeon]|nr:LAGLIDADG family homing endonuclease [Candidatus Lokiarchaeota archaeon]
MTSSIGRGHGRQLQAKKRMYADVQILSNYKPLTNDLKRHKFLNFKSNKDKFIPRPIKNILNRFKQESIGLKIPWTKNIHGKIALAWLLGFYDGDGTHKEGKTGIIYSSSRELLKEIKEDFGSPNKIYVNSTDEYFSHNKKKSQLCMD